jgi:hypothetical protein
VIASTSWSKWSLHGICSLLCILVSMCRTICCRGAWQYLESKPVMNLKRCVVGAVHSTNTDQGNWRGTMPAAADLSIASQPTTPRDALTDVLVTPSARNLAAALPHQLNTAALHVFGARGPSLAQSSLACDNTALGCTQCKRSLSIRVVAAPLRCRACPVFTHPQSPPAT